jgi:hypothetical protein
MQSRKAAKRQRKLASYEVAGLELEMDIRRGATMKGGHFPLSFQDGFHFCA